MAVNERIKEQLEKHDMTQKELAEKTNTTEAAISRYVKGERQPRADVLAKMARVFDVSIEYMMNGEENPDDFSSIRNLVARNAGNFTDEQRIQLTRIIMRNV